MTAISRFRCIVSNASPREFPNGFQWCVPFVRQAMTPSGRMAAVQSMVTHGCGVLRQQTRLH